MTSTFLLPIADRDPLLWVIREQRTAFPEYRRRAAERLREGDVILLYTTRGCFRNPTRDRGRVVGRAVVSARARRLRRPVSFMGRAYTIHVPLTIETLASQRTGVELSPLVPALSATFPDPASWSARMRRALVPVADLDAKRLNRSLAAVAAPYPQKLDSYS